MTSHVTCRQNYIFSWHGSLAFQSRLTNIGLRRNGTFYGYVHQYLHANDRLFEKGAKITTCTMVQTDASWCTSHSFAKIQKNKQSSWKLRKSVTAATLRLKVLRTVRALPWTAVAVQLQFNKFALNSCYCSARFGIWAVVVEKDRFFGKLSRLSLQRCCAVFAHAYGP